MTDGADQSPELPAMHEAVLDESTLADYVRDLEACAERLEVRAKIAERGRSSDERPTIASAIEALRSGRARGVQLRYRFDDRDWCDTITSDADGIRLIRLESPGS